MDREDKMAGYAHQGKDEKQDRVRKIKMDLTIIGLNGDIAIFTLVGRDAEDKKHVKDRKIEIPKGDRDVDLEYDLYDGGYGLDFNEADPIWVSRTETCPQHHCSDNQIVGIRAQKKKLTVTDLNTDDVELGYTIVLTGAKGLVKVDPIIRNNP